MKAVLSLFDLTGAMVEPWIKDGYQCFIFDIQHPDISIPDQLEAGTNPVKVSGDYQDWNLIIGRLVQDWKVEMIFSFPPCTDLAVSGASHFAKKLMVDPLYRQKAMDMVYFAGNIAYGYDIPCMIENPVSVISSEWRKPDYIFHPYEYGGYIPIEDKTSPYDLIPTRDAYTKKTCLWIRNGHDVDFNMPEKRPVELPTDYKYSPQHLKLGGKSLKTKNIRSATPRGFAYAIWDANRDNFKATPTQYPNL
jgi:hypothetical protein